MYYKRFKRPKSKVIGTRLKKFKHYIFNFSKIKYKITYFEVKYKVKLQTKMDIPTATHDHTESG